MKKASWLITTGSILLIGTALFHATGYGSISKAIESIGAKIFLISAVKALWLMFSAHLIILSVIAAVAAWMPKGRK